MGGILDSLRGQNGDSFGLCGGEKIFVELPREGACEEGDGGKMLVGEEKEKKPRERPPLLGSEKGLVFGT